ncbi:MAG: 4Fe-4S dicluster domain-containing protein [Desulfobacteraceae bacterium]|nr:4Fe-4S dicluster domain-containing protein [Desulfobacteraceae bacterium]
MKQVIVHPERCVGCMQCMLACATAHSKSGSLFSAVTESPGPRPRIHVGAGMHEEGFPNRCRHCDPAPCQMACLPGAIYRQTATNTVLVNPDVCINCASCAMACPYGVIRYHEDPLVPAGKTVAIKCDNCTARQQKGLIPACVEVCKTGALTFEESDRAMKRKTVQVARSVTAEAPPSEQSQGFALLHTVKKAITEINQSR